MFHQTHTLKSFNQELMRGQEESTLPSFEAEVKALQEELQLVLKKEREAQVFTLCNYA